MKPAISMGRGYGRQEILIQNETGYKSYSGKAFIPG